MKPEAASSASRRGAPPDAGDVTPVKHQPLSEPWTPTANLKMLISVASPDIREREIKKVLFTLTENDRDKVTSAGAAADDAEAGDPSQVFEQLLITNIHPEGRIQSRYNNNRGYKTVTSTSEQPHPDQPQ